MAGGNGRGGTSELASIKREVKTVITGVLVGRIEKGAGAVALQGYNTLRGMLELERRIKETEELQARIEALEQAAERRGGRSWGA